MKVMLYIYIVLKFLRSKTSDGYEESNPELRANPEVSEMRPCLYPKVRGIEPRAAARPQVKCRNVSHYTIPDTFTLRASRTNMTHCWEGKYAREITARPKRHG